MNERIRELAKNHLVHEHFSRYGELVEEKQYEFYPDELEQFVELIVKECANRLREIDYELMFVEDGMCDPSISDVMLIAASDIEEHFGVE